MGSYTPRTTTHMFSSIPFSMCLYLGVISGFRLLLYYIFVFAHCFVHEPCRWVSRLNSLTFVVLGPVVTGYTLWAFLIVKVHARHAAFNFFDVCSK